MKISVKLRITRYNLGKSKFILILFFLISLFINSKSTAIEPILLNLTVNTLGGANSLATGSFSRGNSYFMAYGNDLIRVSYEDARVIGVDLENVCTKLIEKFSYYNAYRKAILCNDENVVKIYDQTNSIISLNTAGHPKSLAYSPEGKLLAVALKGELKFFETNDYSISYQIKLDGDLIAWIDNSRILIKEETDIVLFDFSKKRTISRIVINSQVNDISPTFKDKYIAVSTNNGIVIVQYDIDSMWIINKIGFSRAVSGAIIVSNQAILGVDNEGIEIYTWLGENFGRLPLSSQIGGPIRMLYTQNVISIGNTFFGLVNYSTFEQYLEKTYAQHFLGTVRTDLLNNICVTYQLSTTDCEIARSIISSEQSYDNSLVGDWLSGKITSDFFIKHLTNR
ncbi:hypothetical protein GCM10008956_29930 [Deinococcus arenae]|uniref:Uncharacterized protein n=1 Tax=Deinococcus arenae TaxID=1452751 RepID=A0A8H9LCD3_9DEIO|nr:hypothetical protein [Deinococcus arenae]GGM51899.1 hypothetical protein GCM10008956_29930 [Deinococcus arenae]